MKEFFSFVKIILSVCLVSISMILLVSALVSVNVKTKLFSFDLANRNLILNDTVVVHFIHGSIPETNCDYQKKRLGGLLGGHIELEVKGKVYGFLYDNLPIHTFSQKKFNSKFEALSKTEWEIKNENDRITSIYIPTEKKKMQTLQAELASNLNSPPYDYAFIGHRCTSSTASLLSEHQIINTFSDLESIIAFFYPRTFRGALIKFAKINKLKIKFAKGSDCHLWEG